MTEQMITFIALLSPAVFIAVAIASWFQPGLRPKGLITLSRTATVISLIIVGLSSYYVSQLGLMQSGFIGWEGLGFSIRLDALSVLMLTMISILGFIIVKYSLNYLDGDQHQGAFIGRLAATIASVQLLVLSGNMGLLFAAWVMASISLHRLLIFYRERPGAQIVAKKKFLLARLGDACLLVAMALLYNQFKTGNLEVIFSSITSTASTGYALELSAFFLALAAILKSAQFPTHGWLVEVIETPTPVSALLHAGLLNAGPFLIIRMAYVMEVSSAAPIFLMTVGGFTALFASIAFLTQTSIKTALGYSSVGHMGFSLLLCGLGAYPAALLHLVAHSFYKAHAFLSSGSVIDVMRSNKVIDSNLKLNPFKVALGIIMALVLYSGFAIVWGLDMEKDLSLIIIGAVITMGLARLFTSAIARQWNLKLMTQAILMALIVATAFFTLESGTHHLIASQVPDLNTPGFGRLLVAGILLIAFAAVVFIQMIAPQLNDRPYYRNLAVHFRNGFYANAWFDRIVKAMHIHSPESKQTLAMSLHEPLYAEPKEAKPSKVQADFSELEEKLTVNA